MRPIHSALATIEAIGRLQPVGVSVIARELDLPKTTVHRVLKALEVAGWICAAGGDRVWSLTIEAALAVGASERATRRLRSVAFPVMEELRRLTGESLYLAVRHDDNMALVERLDGVNPIAHAWPLWQRGPLHSTSLGKSILSFLPDDQLDAYLGGDLRPRTRYTIVDPVKLRAVVLAARERGFATSFGENWPNENGVGAAIRDPRGNPSAAISISAPRDRVSEDACMAMGELLSGAARRISLGPSRS